MFERSDFGQLTLWEGVVALKGLICNNFHLGRMWRSGKHCFWIIFTWKEMMSENDPFG